MTEIEEDFYIFQDKEVANNYARTNTIITKVQHEVVETAGGFKVVIKKNSIDKITKDFLCN